MNMHTCKGPYKNIHVYVECLENAEEHEANNNIKACILCPVEPFSLLAWGNET